MNRATEPAIEFVIRARLMRTPLDQYSVNIATYRRLSGYQQMRPALIERK